MDSPESADSSGVARVPGRRRRKALVALVAALLATLVPLGMGEAYFRFLAPVHFGEPLPASRQRVGFSLLHLPSDIPGLEYELAHGAEQPAPYFGDMVIHTNSEGMRGPEVTREKPPGVVRIAALGDSFTFGHGVADGECFPVRLQELLDEHLGGGRFEVLNFGITGYSTQDEARLLEARVMAFSPDVVVVTYVLNDPEPHPRHDLHRTFHQYGWLDHLHLYRRIRQALYERAEKRAGGYFQLLHDPAGPYWPTTLDGLDRIRDLTEAAGIPVVVVIVPIIAARSWDHYELGPLHEQVAAACRERGFRVCDLRERLPRHGLAPKDLQIEGNGHANVQGNRLIALEIGLFLQASFPELFAAPAVGAESR
jgi:hypothetical protein